VSDGVSDGPDNPAEEPVEEVDCRGLPCPTPVIRLARALPGVPVGALVAVAADDVAARTDIPAWCRMRGQEYVGERVAGDGVPVHLVRRRT
jgi:tRNA 2-thiouridine synthesizing protein A